MVDDRLGQEDAGLARQAEPEAEIDIFAEAEEAFVKAAMALENLTAEHGARAAWAEAFALTRQFAGRTSKPATPRHTENEIGVPCTVEYFRVGLVILGRGKHGRIRMPFQAGADFVQPVCIRHGIRVEADQPGS